MTSNNNKTTQTSAHAVILLAAGLSQRLGTPKQLLMRARLPLIAHMVRVAVLSDAKKVIVITPAHLPEVTSAVKGVDIPPEQLLIVENTNSSLGMAHSLQLGMDALRAHAGECSRVLIMGVDQIHLDIGHVKDLLAASRPVVVSRYPATAMGNTDDDGKHILGLPVVVETAQLYQWYEALSGDKGLRALIRSTDQSIHTVNNARLRTDIDTPAQLADAQACGWLDT